MSISDDDGSTGRQTKLKKVGNATNKWGRSNRFNLTAVGVKRPNLDRLPTPREFVDAFVAVRTLDDCFASDAPNKIGEFLLTDVESGNIPLVVEERRQRRVGGNGRLGHVNAEHVGILAWHLSDVADDAIPG